MQDIVTRLPNSYIKRCILDTTNLATMPGLARDPSIRHCSGPCNRTASHRGGWIRRSAGLARSQGTTDLAPHTTSEAIIADPTVSEPSTSSPVPTVRCVSASRFRADEARWPLQPALTIFRTNNWPRKSSLYILRTDGKSCSRELVTGNSRTTLRKHSTTMSCRRPTRQAITSRLA